MVSITGPAAEILDIMNKFGATGGNSPNFNPLILNVTKDGFTIEKASIDHTAFVDGTYEMATKGKGQLVVEVAKVIAKVKKSFTKSEVTLTYENGELVISKDGKRAKTTPPSPNHIEQKSNPFKLNKKGVPLIDGISQKPKPATTYIIIDADELKQLLPEAKEASIDYFRFVFDKEGSVAWVGEEGGDKDTYNTDLNCTVKGEHADVTYSASFKEIIHVLEGEIEIYIAGNSPITPMWIKQPLKNGTVNYILAGRTTVED